MTEVERLVYQWSVNELNHFFGNIDISNPNQMAKEDNAHWYCRGDCSGFKSTKTEEMTPMYILNGKYVSVQRIIWILKNRHDPIYKANIINRCNVSSCVNPSHLTINKDFL